MKKDFKVKVLFAGLVISGAFVGGATARAATLGVVVNNTAPEIGGLVRVDIPLDTQGDDANAIQGQILFPADQFALRSVNDGASPISFWVEPPTEIASGVIAFSGIMPGGFQGAASSVVSLWLVATAPGTGNISLGDVELLRNDGNATPIMTTTSTALITISGIIASSTPTRPVSLIAPEAFTPVISQNQNVFDGQYFLAFSTTDKGSGIDHYEVLEAPDYGWQVATSPYLLRDQTLESNIYVRAVDHAGNFIIVEVPAEHPAGEHSLHIQGEILIVLLCILLITIIWASRAMPQ